MVQDGIHLRGDGHFNSARTSEFDGCMSREYAFGHHAMHGCDDLRKLASAAQLNSHAAVARKATGAGEDEIAQPCESGHRILAAPARYDQAGDLCQTARDQGSDGVVPKSQAITNSGSDGNDVLQCAA